ncbi:glycosyltransferase [Paraburkholderia acidicola]|uniref:Glycosyltransferase n=1 Tax=Paraburkholderia acidicola TaxID=1912599 RepID=A0ABV1LVT0_9BURK
MLLNTNFRGRIFQTVEALDYGDAVSNQVIALDTMLKEMGVVTSIYSQWHHADVAGFRQDLSELAPTDEDVIILHYAGYSDHMLPFVQDLRCTKICVYHNITPHTFFRPGTDLYDFCLKGREQLHEIVQSFHYFWGDSNYNLQELIELGANPENCALVPIIVEKKSSPSVYQEFDSREKGAWIFLGRIAANKGQVNLVKQFAKAHVEDERYARTLYIIGNHNPHDPYFQELQRVIKELGVSEAVILTGKLSDAEVENYLARASVYVSMSEHEGFGVPLIEAAHYGIPVIALRNSAIGETLGDGPLLADSPAQIFPLIKTLLGDKTYYEKAVSDQWRNAMRFSNKAVNSLLIDALRPVLPERFRFSTVSVVICTYNRSDLLERCLDYLTYQSNQNFEVIVINGPSKDNTDIVITNYSGKIKSANNSKRNLSISRNMGIELSDGDLIAFIDDDAIPFDDWIDTLLREFNERPLTHAAIGGPAYYSGTLKFQAQDIGINKLAVARVDIDSEDVGRDGWERSMLGTNTCFRADIIRNVRGFDEQFDYFLDESEISFRLQTDGYIVGYAPELYLRHEFAKSDNRGGKHKFNWFSICKNTAYFIAAYSGLKGKELKEYVTRRMHEERITSLEWGFKAGEIGRREYDSYIEAIHTGAAQGLMDACEFPRTRELKTPPGSFRVYACAPRYPVVGREINSLHICIITKEFPPFVPGGGIGTLYYHLASELLLMGHHITVVVPGDFKSTYRQGRFSIHYEPVHTVCSDSISATGFTTNANWSISALHAISEIHAENPIDVVDSALWDSEALALSLIPRRQRPPLVLRLVTPFPVAARINGWSMSEGQIRLFEASERTLIQNADAVVPISESIARTIEIEHNLQRDTRWTKSYCGIAYWPSFDVWSEYSELQSINNQPLNFPKNAKLILFVGRLERRKGCDILLAAAVEFLTADPLAHLVLAGKDGENWSMSSKAKFESGIAARVHFVGEVDDATRDKLLHAAYCVVFPSRYESFGLVPLEAFVHGAPVIATNAGAIPEVVADNECGLLFEAENSSSLAKCVTRLLLEPNLRERLSAGARKQIRNFSSRKSAINTIKLYSTLVAQRKRANTPVRQVRKGTVATAQKNHSYSYVGSHPRLLTQCGQRDGRQMKSTGRAGFLLHGPYVDLPAGKYRVNLYGQVINTGAPKAFVEAIIESGAKQLAAQTLFEVKDDAQLVSMDILLEASAQVEIRVWVSSESEMLVRKLVILSEQDISQ